MLTLLASCKKMPSDVIKEGKMAELLADLHTAGAVIEINASTWRDDSSRMALRQAIFMRHNVTEAQVDSSLMWYGHNLQDYLKVYDKTLAIIDKRMEEAERAGGKAVKTSKKAVLDGDSVNIWQGPEAIRISPANPSEFISFAYTSDRNWERGDRFTLSLTPVATRSPIEMAIVAQYNDGIAEYITHSQVSDTRQSLSLVLDSAKTANRLYGTIRYVPASDEISFLDSITLVRTRTRDNNVADRRGQQTVRLR